LQINYRRNIYLKKLPDDRGLHGRPGNIVEEVIDGSKKFFGFNKGK